MCVLMLILRFQHFVQMLIFFVRNFFVDNFCSCVFKVAIFSLPIYKLYDIHNIFNSRDTIYFLNVFLGMRIVCVCVCVCVWMNEIFL